MVFGRLCSLRSAFQSCACKINKYERTDYWIYKAQRTALSAELVVPTKAQVPHPRECGVASFLNNFQIPHLNARYCEEGNLKFNGDRRSLVRIFLIANGGKGKANMHIVGFSTRELLDGPHNGIQLWRILS